MRALLVANHDDADPGLVGERFQALGWEFVTCPRERPGEWPGLDGAGLLLSLGSDWSVYWDHVRESVAAEAALIRAAHAQGVPVLGICFGGQVISHALGGSVERAPEPEVGWFDVTSTVPALAGRGPWFQWHADRFAPPAGAERLAASPRAQQAYRVGRTLALQFHPEVTEAIVARWAAGGAAELARLGVDAAALVERTRAEVPRTRQDAAALVDWFCEAVAGSAG